MQRSWYSASWYRVAQFKPRLRSHANIYRHHFRGGLWYVLQDRTSGRFHRFTPEVYQVISLMDGSRSVEEIWELVCERLDADAITQDEMIGLLGKLYSADVLYGDVPPDIVELSDRSRKMKRQKMIRSVLNPLALRLPVFDPDDFLNATLPLVRPFISWFGALLFFAVLAYAGTLTALHWDELTANVFDRVLATENLLLLLIAYPCTKALHELGHAYVIKRWGGDVHEIGLMFLVFMPVPYVDASDSIAFHSKWQRALVAGAGILTEIFLAALAMVVWVSAEEGIVRAFAFNVMLIGGVSTLLFNGNPLLKFDGYYVLCDLLEIPNLAPRGNRYLGYLIQRYAFGLSHAESPVTAPREGFWFLTYSISSFLYRLFITFAIIVLLVSMELYAVGVALAIWAVFLMLVLPLLKQGWYLLTSPALRRHRGRALGMTAAVLMLIVAVLFFIPVPYNTLAQGYVATNPQSAVNAGADGVVVELLVEPGEEVQPGTPLIRLDDPLHAAQLAMLEARIAELELRLQAEQQVDQAAARVVSEELKQARANLDAARVRAKELIVRSGEQGYLILPEYKDLIGRFIRRGDPLAYVASFQDPMIRVVVNENSADQVRRNTQGLSVRFAASPQTEYSARIVRDEPALSTELPSLVLATEGGGEIPLDPAAGPGRIQALESLLRLDLRLTDAPDVATYGDRVYVRFSHGSEPVAARLYRGMMQVFLRYFSV
ncbi:efflux RND transporter periplasmic adaptor subunit [Marinobacterium sp. YM272]|uniref:efflux RND transporter periplasmic adaptor subunit n=1 Tax=Marinobacterium sp. YM272 TaxID=3421654 RepID=UPI003D7FDAF1